MTLVESQQKKFARLLPELMIWAYAEGERRSERWDFTFADGHIDPIRKVRDIKTGLPFQAEDAQHKRGGLHYQRLAMDLNLWVNGELVTRAHPVWTAIGERWLSMDSDCAWGGDWDEDHKPYEPGEHDANHLSLAFGGWK